MTDLEDTDDLELPVSYSTDCTLAGHSLDLGGCVVWAGQPEWACPKCRESLW